MRQQEFERLYAEHAAPLLAFLDYRTGDRSLAEDLLADTFVRALQGRRRFDPRRGSEKAWLYTIALNLLRDHSRRAAIGERVHERVRVGRGDQPAYDQVSAIDDRDSIRRALKTLSSEEREAIALRYGADLSVPEIAKVTGQKQTTIEGRIYRALRKLKEQLE